jgi:polar amino acid transport system permease protein
VPKGQREAAQALGMPEGLIMRRIVLPQAFRIVTPAIGNDFVSMIKDSSLVYVLGVQELLWRASTIGRRELSSLEALLIAAAVYWGMTIIFSYFQERIEKRMARGDR